MKRFHIIDIDLLNRIVAYIHFKLFFRKSKKYFESISRRDSLETLYNYLGYITKANLINGFLLENINII